MDRRQPWPFGAGLSRAAFVQAVVENPALRRHLPSGGAPDEPAAEDTAGLADAVTEAVSTTTDDVDLSVLDEPATEPAAAAPDPAAEARAEAQRLRDEAAQLRAELAVERTLKQQRETAPARPATPEGPSDDELIAALTGKDAKAALRAIEQAADRRFQQRRGEILQEVEVRLAADKDEQAALNDFPSLKSNEKFRARTQQLIQSMKQARGYTPGDIMTAASRAAIELVRSGELDASEVSGGARSTTTTAPLRVVRNQPANPRIGNSSARPVETGGADDDGLNVNERAELIRNAQAVGADPKAALAMYREQRKANPNYGRG